MERVVVLIDMDCFYAQVEQREVPELWGTPVVVVQHAREGAPGGIIAVSYEARSYGVKRGMMIPEAVQKCPELNVCYVPQGEHIDKADIQKYRDASAEIFAVLHSIDSRIIVERASVDEAFLDMTTYVDETMNEQADSESIVDRLLCEASTSFPTSHLADGKDRNDEKLDEFTYDREDSIKQWLDVKCRSSKEQLRLALATELVEKIRADINRQTQFFCSAGIGNNKMIAKLVCARHKPRQQTVVPFDCIPAVFRYTPISDVRMMGGKLGSSLKQAFGITTMSELSQIDLDTIARQFPAQSQWIYGLAKGLCDEPVKARSSQSSIAVSKNFPGKNAIVTVGEMRRWLDGLAKELSKRLLTDQLANNRTAENLVFGLLNSGNTSKTLKINSYNPTVIYNIIWTAAKSANKAEAGSNAWDPPVLNIHLSASRFSDGISAESRSIVDWVNERIREREQGMNASANAAKQARKANAGNSSNSVVETAPEQPNLDDEGWQIFDPSTLNDAVYETVPEEIIDMGEVKVSKSVYDELPDFIKAELKHEKTMADARQLKAIAASKAEAREKEKGGPVKGKKRAAKTTKAEPPPKRKIDSFFKKS